jgi:hypothetical protein
MSVYRCDYIVYGYKLPYTKELSKELMDESKDSYDYWNGGFEEHHLIIDQMAGQYIVFGKVLYSKDYYANEAENTFMDFEDIDFNSLNNERLMEHYKVVFGEYPIDTNFIEIDRSVFAFSHIY